MATSKKIAGKEIEMIDLNNVPDKILNSVIKNIAKIGLPKGKFRKINTVWDLYKKSDEHKRKIIEIVEGYLYSGWGPIEIITVDWPGGNLSSEDFLKKLRRYLVLGEESYTKALVGSLKPAPDEEPKLNKIRLLNNEKILVQFSLLDRVTTGIYDYDLVEMSKIKVVNSVFDSKRQIFQIRTDLTTCEKCHEILELFKPCSLKKIAVTEPFINKMRADLGGKTYEYQGTRKGVKPIKYKILKKGRGIGDIRAAPTFPGETANYDLSSDFFSFDYAGESCRLQLTIDHSRLYFRKFANEAVIDYVLDKL